MIRVTRQSAWLVLALLVPARASADRRPAIEVALRRFAADYAGEKKCATVAGLTIDSVTVHAPAASARVTILLDDNGRPEIVLRDVMLARDKRRRWRAVSSVASELAIARELERASSAGDRRAILRLHPEMITAELDRILYADALTKTNDGDDDEAERLAAIGRDIALQVGDRGGECLLLGIDVIAKRDAGESRASVALAREALNSAEETSDPDVIARALINLGRAIDVADPSSMEPFDIYRRAADLEPTITDRTLVVRALHNIATDFCDRRTDLRSARPYFERAIKLAAQIGDRIGEASSELGLATTYETEEECGPAWIHIRRAIRVAPAGPFRTDGFAILAKCYLKEGNLSRADQLNKKALSGMTAQADRAIRYELLNTAAIIHHRRGQDAIALREAEVGYRGLESLGFTGETIFPQLLIDLHRSSEAVALLEPALPRAQKREADTYVIYQTLLGIAYRSLGKQQQAEGALRAAIHASELLRPMLGGDDLQDVRWFGDLIRAYRESTDFFIETGRYDEALRIAELQKGRGILDVVKHGWPSLESEMDADDRAKEATLREELTKLNRQIADAEDRDVAPLRGKLEDAQAEYDAFRADLYARHPRMKIGSASVDIASTTEMAAHLPTRTAFVEYISTDHWLDALVVQKKEAGEIRITAHRIHLSQTALRNLTSRFSRQLARRDLEFQTTSRQLYKLLLAPLAPEVAGAESICIMPDDALWGVPFETLIDVNGKYLVERAPIFYAPSISAYLAMVSRSSEPTTIPLLAAGDPSSSKALRADVESFYRGVTLGRLPDAEREVNTVGSFYGPASRVYTGTAASKAAVTANAPHARVLHFATHAILDDHSPMFSRIILADDKSKADDGMLEAWEVMNLHLNANLVVLSACHTAGGKVGAGEGIIGMSWAFFAAGARSVVASHWNVSSVSTSDMMIAFHRALLTPGASVASALRTAKLTVMRNEQYAHPFYWAPFVLLGADR